MYTARMDLPSENWVIANIIGIGIYMALCAAFDMFLGLPITARSYAFLASTYAIFTVVDVYFYHHKAALREEKKSIGRQLRDMMGSIGACAVILALGAVYVLHQRRRAAARLAAALQELSTKKK